MQNYLLVVVSLVVCASAFNCLEVLVSDMICCVSSWTLTCTFIYGRLTVL